MSDQIADGPSLESGRVEVVQIVDSLSDENARLVSQGGVFTRAPIGLPLERWVAQAFEGALIPVLVKVHIPDGDRDSCLRGLELMNISHASLFPDLAGASRAANLKLELYPKIRRR